MEPFVARENTLASSSSPRKKRQIDHTESVADGSPILTSISKIEQNSTGGGGDAMQMSMEAVGGNNSSNHEIDEDLHSRQLAVYGRETMTRLFASNILISGIQGLGVEIAKNIIFAGVKSVTLHKLQELNDAVDVSALTGKLTKEQLSGFQAVVFVDTSFEKATEFDDYCHHRFC